MTWNVLANTAADNLREVGVGEAALYAGLGYLIVFLGIAFLILVIWAIGKLVPALEAKTKKVKVEAKSVQEEIKPQTSVQDELSDEVIAVITAAIAAYYQQENKKCEFTVKRIKRL
jgi:sodium pump decarboxylase gamma subunit